MTTCQFIPPFLLQRLSSRQGALPEDGASRTLGLDAGFRDRRASTAGVPSALTDSERAVSAAAPEGAPWRVYTATNGTDLPGSPVRAAGEPESGDVAVDEAAFGVAASLALFAEVYGRSSYDDQGAPVIATVHYERDYDNAFWDGNQLVFGDGDGEIFERFTKPVDVLGHELTHAVTEFTAGLVYADQSGALNESVSDVFASCLKQRLLGQSAAEADWLIGEGIFTARVQGRALRSMAEPGTAYDDPQLGKDPQVGTMADYLQTTEDNGGVHTNSGIPNKAFQLAAVGLGGNSWETAGRVWYAALTSGIPADTDFAGFAAATVTAAEAVSGDAAATVREAWSQVGVEAPGAEPRVAVTRSGGFAGRSSTGELRLGQDARSPEVEQLLERIDPAAVAAHQPQPDRYVYDFELRGQQLRVGEHELTPELAQLVRMLLE